MATCDIDKLLSQCALDSPQKLELWATDGRSSHTKNNNRIRTNNNNNNRIRTNNNRTVLLHTATDVVCNEQCTSHSSVFQLVDVECG